MVGFSFVHCLLEVVEVWNGIGKIFKLSSSESIVIGFFVKVLLSVAAKDDVFFVKIIYFYLTFCWCFLVPRYFDLSEG